ncbi:hypothetical protein [Paenibacillus sp. FSL M7-0134]|uniref:hypothetical protein n=1 Tax=Paenibacillus sp. FSL M7-0134 TaxID=2954754 RepID=UPI0030F51179
MENVKLSELPNETKVGYEDSSCVYTAGELREIVRDDEILASHTWYAFEERHWRPDAKLMLKQWIEYESEELYEDWEERASKCLKQEHYDRIQAVLNDAFASDHVTKYWMLDGPEVIIDTLDRPSA